MPSIKLKGAKAVERQSGFEPYDGPTPTRKGFYRGVIKKLQYRRNKNSQSMGFYIVAELEAAKGDPKDQAQFDGYPLFISSIITESGDGSELKEGAQRNLDNFLAALGTGDEPTIVFADGDPEDGVDVTKIGNRNPVGAAVNIDIGFEVYMGESRPKANGVYKLKDEVAAGPSKGKISAADLADEDDDLFEPDEEAEEDDGGYAEREAELLASSIPDLRKILKDDYDLPTSGTKPKLVERILEHEFAEADEAEEEPEEDEAEVDEPEDEAEDDEAEDDEAEDEEEDEEEGDDAAYAAREEELNGFNRIALKAVLKSILPDFTVLKRHTDDELREQILGEEFGDELPF